MFGRFQGGIDDSETRAGNQSRAPSAGGRLLLDRPTILRDYAERLTGDAILLYFFLAAVSDKHGLSFTATPPWRHV